MNTIIQNIKFGKEALVKSISNYSRMGIEIEIIDIDNNTARVKIVQSKLVNGYILNRKQLIDRAKQIFELTGIKIKVIPVVYSLDVNDIDIEWIKEKLQEFGLSRNDIIKQLAIDKSSLSEYFSGNRKMNKLVRSAFFYYFLTYEINSGLR